MITEHGIVIKADAGTAWVKTVRTSACQHCSAQKNCQSLGGGQDMEVEAINAARARTGDRVVLSFETSSLLKLSFLLYIFPIIMMIAGAFWGQHLAPALGMDETVSAVLFCVLGFGLSFGIIRLIGDDIGDQERYRPKIIRIRRDPPPERPTGICREVPSSAMLGEMKNEGKREGAV